MFGLFGSKPVLRSFTAVIRENGTDRVIHFMGSTLHEAHENYRRQTTTMGPVVLALFEGAHADVKAGLPEFSFCDPSGL